MHKKIQFLLEMKKQFWQSKEIDPEDECGSTKMQTIVLMFANLFGLILFAAYCGFIASFIVFGELEIWTPRSHPKFSRPLMIYVLTWGVFSIMSTCVCNLLIVAFCVETALQFKLLNYRLNRMDVKWQGNNINRHGIILEMKEIARHHSFLLE